MDIFWCLSILIFLYFAFCIKNYTRTVLLAFKLSGPPALPVLGNVLLVNNMNELEEYANNASQLYGAFMRCWISIIPFFVIYEPRHLKIILGGKNSKKTIFYKFLSNFFGDGLITRDGIKWRTHRKLIQPYFRINMLENFIDIFSKNAEKLLSGLEEGDIKITPFINKCILGILHEAVLGVHLEDDTESPYRKGEVLLNQRITRPWLLLDTIFKRTRFGKTVEIQKMTLHSYTEKVLLERRGDLKKLHPESLLDMFIEIAEINIDFKDEDIINEAVTFMLAGHDTVGSAVAFTLYYIAKYKDIQEKIVQELNEVYVDEKITITALCNLKYLEQCIKESLRLTPSVPIISRTLTEDVILDGRTFPAGTNIFISPLITQRLPHHYPDPLRFDPERFSQENVDKRHPFAFIPFSMGQRNCIGYKFAMLEMQIILATVLSRFHISLVPGHEHLNMAYRTALRAVGGVWLHLTPRK